MFVAFPSRIALQEVAFERGRDKKVVSFQFGQQREIQQASRPSSAALSFLNSDGSMSCLPINTK
jgi:hypothetical protein